MTLSETMYASLLPSYIKGLINTYSTVSDPLVISGFIKSNNIEWVPYNLDGGITCMRAPTFTGELKTDQTRFNRADFQRNRLTEVSMPSMFFQSSVEGQPTFGALDDPRRLARIISLGDMSAMDESYLTSTISGHALASYYNYLENFVAQIYKDCKIKTDYDNTTGPDGVNVTFENDVKYPAYKMVTDIDDIAVPGNDRALALLKELRRFITPMKKYIQGQPIFFILNDSTFAAFRDILEIYKYSQTHARYQDTSVGGTFQYQNATVFTTGDLVFVGMPDTGFPTKVVDTENAFRCLAIVPNAIKMKVSQGDLTNSPSIFNNTIMSYNIGNPYDILQDSISEQGFAKIQSYMGIEPNISAFMGKDALGGNTIPNLLKIYTNQLGSGTDANAEYIYTRAEYNIGIIRANPYGLREFQVKPSLIGYTVTP